MYNNKVDDKGYNPRPCLLIYRDHIYGAERDAGGCIAVHIL